MSRNVSPWAALCEAYGLNPNDVVAVNRDDTGVVTFTIIGELQLERPNKTEDND